MKKLIQHIEKFPLTVRPLQLIQHFLFVSSGTLNVNEGIKQRNFKKESCLLLQKGKTYTISQVGDENIDVYEFKSVKKATTN